MPERDDDRQERRGPTRRVGGQLAAAIKAIQVDGSAVDDAALKRLALNVALDADFDDDTAAHARVQLDALKLVHQINLDNKADKPDDAGGFTAWLDKIRGAKKGDK